MKKYNIKTLKFGAENTNPLAAIESARMDIERNVQKLANGMTITRGGDVTKPANSSIGNTDNTNMKIGTEKFGTYSFNCAEAGEK